MQGGLKTALHDTGSHVGSLISMVLWRRLFFRNGLRQGPNRVIIGPRLAVLELQNDITECLGIDIVL